VHYSPYFTGCKIVKIYVQKKITFVIYSCVIVGLFVGVKQSPMPFITVVKTLTKAASFGKDEYGGDTSLSVS
jgi:Na+-translocating ferredoxin:NAD+ oxidoreductase RnfD subunit